MERPFSWRTHGSPFGKLHSWPFSCDAFICAGCSSNKETTASASRSHDCPGHSERRSIHQEWVGRWPAMWTRISAKVEGFLLARLYTEGSYVEKGQPMFTRQRQAEAAVDQATGNLERARAALSQHRLTCTGSRLWWPRELVSQAELDKAQSFEELHRSRGGRPSGFRQCQLNLGWTSVTSPIAGIAGVSKVGIAI